MIHFRSYKLLLILVIVFIIILYYTIHYNYNLTSQIFYNYSSSVVTIYNSKSYNKDAQTVESDSILGFFITKDGLILTVFHGFTSSKDEYIVEYIDQNNRPTTSTFSLISVNPNLDLAILSPKTKIGKIKYLKIQKLNNIIIGDNLYVLSSFRRRNYKKGNVFNTKGIIPATVISRLEYNHFAIDSLSFHGMSGAPIIDKKGYVKGLIISVTQQKAQLTDTYVQYQLSDKEVKIPYVVSITRYSIGRSFSQYAFEYINDKIKHRQNYFRGVRGQSYTNSLGKIWGHLWRLERLGSIL